MPHWFYVGLKGAPSALWCFLIPLQHNATIRRRRPLIHRFDGYIAAILSFELGAAGYYMMYRGWLTTHPNPLHIHSIYSLKFPPFAWPTFATSLVILGPLYFLSLFKMVLAARARRFEKHRRWAVLHSMSGYRIAIGRALGIGLTLAARLLHSMSETLKYGWLELPTDWSNILDAEVSAFAWTVGAANFIVGVWVYRQLSQNGQLRGELGASRSVLKAE